MIGFRNWRSVLLATTIGLALAAPSKDHAEVQSWGGPVVMRRLTEAEYRHVIRDVFGSSIVLTARFPPDLRAEQLVAVGTGEAIITASTFENYDRMAKGIAAQVVDAAHRDQYIHCKPKSLKAPDEACARQTLKVVGRVLFQRPLTQSELDSFVKTNKEATAQVNDFYTGLGLSIASLLSSPQFLYRHEQIEPVSGMPGHSKLTGYGIASRLSFLLWDTIPDTQLANAAASGDLETPRGLTREVDRMLGSPRLADGLREFFDDMLGFDGFETLAKDTELYPNYNRFIAADAREQTLRTIVDQLLTRNGDYRDLFTTDSSFATALLGSTYGTPVKTQRQLPGEWTPYDMSAVGHPQAGILTQASFLMLHSHPGRSSPTLRGRAIRELVLCQKIPDPPANVDFSLFEAAGGPSHTARERLSAHAINPACASCHRMMDPIGLALENYNTISSYRDAEDSVRIDASGVLDGVKYSDAAGLGKAVHDNPRTAKCLVSRLYSYAVGRKPTKDEAAWLDGDVLAQFSGDGYRIRSLLRRIALDPRFYHVIQTPAANG